MPVLANASALTARSATPVGGGGGGGPEKRRKQQPRPRRKQQPRPYTEYHIFYRLERARILQAKGVPLFDDLIELLDPNHHDPLEHPRPRGYEHVVLPPYWYSKSRMAEIVKKRKHEKKEGMMLDMQTLNRTMGASWREVNPEVESYCRRLARAERERWEDRDAEEEKQWKLLLQERAKERRLGNTMEHETAPPSDLECRVKSNTAIELLEKAAGWNHEETGKEAKYHNEEARLTKTEAQSHVEEEMKRLDTELEQRKTDGDKDHRKVELEGLEAEVANRVDQEMLGVERLPEQRKKTNRSPYTDYIIFYRLERARILQAKGVPLDEEIIESLEPNHHDPLEHPRPRGYEHVILPPAEIVKERKHEKKEGRIDLHTLNRTMGASWREVNPEVDSYCRRLARAELARWEDREAEEEEQWRLLPQERAKEGRLGNAMEHETRALRNQLRGCMDDATQWAGREMKQHFQSIPTAASCASIKTNSADERTPSSGLERRVKSKTTIELLEKATECHNEEADKAVKCHNEEARLTKTEAQSNAEEEMMSLDAELERRKTDGDKDHRKVELESRHRAKQVNTHEGCANRAITRVNDDDIICGRNSLALKHPGNMTYRKIVSLNKELYATCPRTEKLRISESIVAAIRETNARFVEREDGRTAMSLDEKDENGNLVTWQDIGDKRAIEKTSQALREGQPKLKRKMEQQESESAQEYEVPNYHRTSSVNVGSLTEEAPFDTANFPLPVRESAELLSLTATNQSANTVFQGFDTQSRSREHDTKSEAAASSASATINDDKVSSNSSPQGFDMNMESLSKQQFPTKLYAALELAEAQALGRGSESISWLPDGRAFRILDEQLFMTYVVPMFFTLTKIRSFQRQLNLWGFKRVESGKKHSGAWCHRSFLRGAPAELKKIVRVDIKRNSKKSDAREDHQNEKVPHYHSMPPLPPSRAAKPYEEIVLQVLDDRKDELRERYILRQRVDKDPRGTAKDTISPRSFVKEGLGLHSSPAKSMEPFFAVGKTEEEAIEQAEALERQWEQELVASLSRKCIGGQDAGSDTHLSYHCHEKPLALGQRQRQNQLYCVAIPSRTDSPVQKQDNHMSTKESLMASIHNHVLAKLAKRSKQMCGQEPPVKRVTLSPSSAEVGAEGTTVVTMPSLSSECKARQREAITESDESSDVTPKKRRCLSTGSNASGTAPSGSFQAT